MSRTQGVIVAMVMCVMGSSAWGQQAAPLSALARMPVKEVTVFKDGHAFVMHAGKMPTDSAGNVLMDYLPTPVLGTFWPFSAEKGAKLSAVVASQRKVIVERTALSIREMLEGNPGAQVVITEAPAGNETQRQTYGGTIVGIPVRSSKELEATSPPGSPEMLPQKGSVVILKTAEGNKAVSIDRILDVTFKGETKPMTVSEEFRNLLTLKLDWAGGKAEKTADVGLFYLQKGLRWIPGYKVTIDGKGGATVELQATLVNELTDLEDVTVNLVIGVPTFAFADQIDPISLQQTLAGIEQRMGGVSAGSNRFSNTLSNAMMTQVAAQSVYAAPSEASRAPADLGPEIAGSGRSEDLFLFTVQHVTLKKGQRMVLGVNKVANLKYKDVYVLDIPYTPPAEVWRSLGTSQQAEIARLAAKPKAMHKLRITNGPDYPLTTAPAMIVSGDRVLAQGMMTYTPKGADTDLALTTAVDIQVKKSDKETERTPNAVTWQKTQFGRIDLAGTLTLTNFRPEAVELEVTRNVLGNIGEADHDGKVEMVNILEDTEAAPDSDVHPYWWGWYSWPYWWGHFNGMGRIKWTVKLEAGKSIDLKYTWNYYWQ